MPPEVYKYLRDARDACGQVQAFVHGKSFADYQTDQMLQSAVERQFTIVGEALVQADKLAADLSQSIT